MGTPGARGARGHHISWVQVEAGSPGSPPARAQVTVTPMAAVSGRFLLLGGPGRPLRPGELLRLQLRDVGPPPAPSIYHVLVRDPPRDCPPRDPPLGSPSRDPPLSPGTPPTRDPSPGLPPLRTPAAPGTLPTPGPPWDPPCPQYPPGTP